MRVGHGMEKTDHPSSSLSVSHHCFFAIVVMTNVYQEGAKVPREKFIF